MIGFITLCYLGLVWLISYKLKLIKPTTPVKVIYGSVYLVFIIWLIIAWNMYAPLSSDLRVYGRTVEVVSRVAGRIVDVPVKAGQPLEAGDVLFRLDPTQYQARVDSLEAQLAEAKQNVPQLEEALKQARAEVEAAIADLGFAEAEMKRLQQALESAAVSQSDVEKAERMYEGSTARLAAARAAAEEARLAFESEIDGVNTTVARVEADLRDAMMDLEDCEVRAPRSGRVYNVQLQPGTVVARMPDPVLSFVTDEDSFVIAYFRQNSIRHMRHGDAVEIVLDTYPGRVFPGVLSFTVPISGEGQLPAKGILPDSRPQPEPASFPVRILLDELPEGVELRPANSGTVAVYTQKLPPIGIISKVVLRMTTWLNYL